MKKLLLLVINIIFSMTFLLQSDSAISQTKNDINNTSEAPYTQTNLILDEAVSDLIFKNNKFEELISLRIPKEDDRAIVNRIRNTIYPWVTVQPCPIGCNYYKIDKSLLTYLITNGLAYVELATFKQMAGAFNEPNKKDEYPLDFLFYTDDFKNSGLSSCNFGENIYFNDGHCLAVARRKFQAVTYVNRYKGSPEGIETQFLSIKFKYNLESLGNLPGFPEILRSFEGRARLHQDPDYGEWKLDEIELSDNGWAEYLSLMRSAFREHIDERHPKGMPADFVKFFVEEYSFKSNEKALAIAINKDKNWTGAISFGQSSQAEANRGAMDVCREQLSQKNILADCKVYAEGSRVVLKHFDFQAADYAELLLENIGKLIEEKQFGEADKSLTILDREYLDKSRFGPDDKYLVGYRNILDREMKRVDQKMLQNTFVMKGVVTRKSEIQGSGAFWDFEFREDKGVDYIFSCHRQSHLYVRIGESDIDPWEGQGKLLDDYKRVRLHFSESQRDYILTKCKNDGCSDICPSVIVMLPSEVTPETSATITATANIWDFPITPYKPGSYAGRGFYYDRNHLGEDIRLPEGTPVHAIGPGKIVFYGPAPSYGELVTAVEHDLANPCDLISGNGTPVQTQSFLSIYGHLRACDTRENGTCTGLKIGATVNKETVIGYVNDHSDDPAQDHNGDGREHLHFGLRLSSAEQARQRDSGRWLRGYEQGSGTVGDFAAGSLAIPKLQAGCAGQPPKPAEF